MTEYLLSTSCMAAVLLPVMRRHMMMCSNSITWNAESSGWLSSTETHAADQQPCISYMLLRHSISASCNRTLHLKQSSLTCG